MISDIDTFLAHLKRTGRMKLLPHILKELKADAARQSALEKKTETAKNNPDLIFGSRTLENGTLKDETGKQALLTIYKQSIT